MKHHPLGPSNLPRWQKCPRYDHDGKTNMDLAERGTKMHAVLAGAVDLGSITHIANSDLDYDGKQACFFAYRTITALLRPETRILIEYRAKYQGESAPGLESHSYFGTCDFLLIHGTGSEADLVDFKSGYSGDHIAQLYGYALAFFEMRPRLKSIRGHVIYGQSEKVESILITHPDAHNIVRSILDSRIHNHPPRVNENCPSCAHRLTCPALQAEASLAPIDKGEVALLPISDPAQLMDPSIVSRALQAAKAAETWAAAVKEKANELAKSGMEIPGYALVTRKGARKLADPHQALQNSVLPPELFLKAAKVSVDDLIEQYAELLSCSKAKAAEAMQVELGDLIQSCPDSTFLKSK